MTRPNSHLGSSGLHPCLYRWPILATRFVNGNTYQTKDSLSGYVPVPSPLLLPRSAFHILPSLLFSHPVFPLFHSFISGSHFCCPLTFPSLPPSCITLFRCLTVLLLPTRSPPPFILGSPTVVMRCFIICISQLLIEREFRLSPGSSVRELPWET